MSDAYSVDVTVNDEGVATVEFAAPPANALSIDLARELVDAIVAVGNDGARVIVLCSAGRHFCSGAQLAASAADGSAAGALELYEQAVRLMEQPVPMVAAVQGAAVGGGLGLALAADVVVVAPETKLWPNFARLGTHHGFGLSASLPRAVGPRRAAQLLMSAKDIRGAEACAIGLADHLASDDDVRSTACAVAREIAGNAPLAVRAIRETLRRDFVEEFRSSTALEAAAQSQLAGTSDFQEGVAAMTARRPPQFKGR